MDINANYRPRFDTLNNSHPFGAAAGSLSEFGLFGCLPPELRLRVWKLYLSQNRLLAVTLRNSKKYRDASGKRYAGFPRYTVTNELGRTISGSHYRISLGDGLWRSPLLETSSEARQAAREHYSVRIPSTPGIEHSLFYFSPDYDYIYLRVEGPHGATFVDFMNDAQAFDTQNKGLLHLAINTTDDLFPGHKPLVPRRLSKKAAALFTKPLAELRSLWAVHLLSDDARMMRGLFSGATNYMVRFNRSVPIFSTTRNFTLSSVDPRPIEPDLGKTTVGRHPRTVVQQWKALRESFDISDNENHQTRNNTEYSHVLAVVPSNGKRPVRGHESLDAYLLKEREQWDAWKTSVSNLKGLSKRLEEDERKAQVLSVAGFWVFPGNTFDGILEASGRKHVADLKGCRPALAMFEF